MQYHTPVINQRIFVKPLWQSLFSAFITVLIFMAIEKTAYQKLAGFAVVISISVTSINLNVRLHRKIQIMLYTLVIYTLHIFLGYMAGRHYLLIAPCLIAISWLFSKTKQHLPEVWGDISLPAGLAIYLAFQHDTLWDIEIINLLTGVLAMGLHILFIILYPKRYAAKPRHFTKKRKDTLNTIGLNKILTVYFTQLCLLLTFGTYVLYATLHYFPEYHHAYWFPFTMMIVLQVSHQLTSKRIKDRYIGTILGCIVGSLLLVWHPPYFMMITSLFISLFLFCFYVRKNYKIAVFFVTIFVLLLMGYHFKDSTFIVFERLGFTIGGGLIVYLSSLFFSKRRNQNLD